MSLCLREQCIALRMRVAELEGKLLIAESKNRAAAGLLGDLGMLSARATVMVDVLLGDDDVRATLRDRPTLPEIDVAGDTDPPPPLPSGDEEGARGDVHVVERHRHPTIAEMQACPSCKDAPRLLEAEKAGAP